MNGKKYILLFIIVSIVISIGYISINVFGDNEMPHERVDSIDTNKHIEYKYIRQIDFSTYHKISDNYRINIESNGNKWHTTSVRNEDKLKVITNNSVGITTYSEGFRTDTDNWEYAYAYEDHINKNNAKWITNDYKYITNRELIKKTDIKIDPKYSSEHKEEYRITSDEKRTNKVTPLYSSSMFEISRSDDINMYNYDVKYNGMSVDIYKYESNNNSAIFYLHNQTGSIVYGNITSKNNDNYWNLNYNKNKNKNINIPNKLENFKHNQNPRAISIEPMDISESHLKKFRLNMYPNPGFQNDLKIITETDNDEYITTISGTKPQYEFGINSSGAIVKNSKLNNKLSKNSTITVLVGDKKYVNKYNIYKDNSINLFKESSRLDKLYTSYPHPVNYKINKKDNSMELNIDHTYQISKSLRDNVYLDRQDNWIGQFSVKYNRDTTVIGYTNSKNRYNPEMFALTYGNNENIKTIKIRPDIIKKNKYAIIGEQKVEYNIDSIS